jgi:hypothetical protein
MTGWPWGPGDVDRADDLEVVALVVERVLLTRVEVGSCHSQFSVPLAPAPPADKPEPGDPPDALPQAASAEIATAAAAAAALR